MVAVRGHCQVLELTLELDLRLNPKLVFVEVLDSVAEIISVASRLNQVCLMILEVLL